jgi:hypothetical protein
MARTSDIVLGERFVGLFVGPQGSGKTVGLASFPKPMMVYSFDDRMTPVKRFYPNEKGIEYKVVGAYPSRRRDYIDFKAFCDEFENYQDRCDYATIAIDSITSYTVTVIRYQLNKKGKDKGKRLAGFIEVPTWDEFNGETQAVVETIELSKILPCHIIFTAHPIDKTEITGEKDASGNQIVKKTQSITAFGNKTPSFVPPYFDEIWNFTKEGNEPKRWVYTQAGEDTLCKTALPLPNRFDITNKPMFPLIQQYLAEHQLKLEESVERLRKAAEEGVVSGN